jgi:hypothetical protein
VAKTVQVPEEDARILRHLEEVDAYMDELGFDIHDVEPNRDTGITMCKYTSSTAQQPVHVSFPLSKASLSDKEWAKWIKGFKKHMEEVF